MEKNIMDTFSNMHRTFLISDTHFGVRNSSNEWMEIQKEYFYNFLIPLLKKESKKGDVLIHCGDVFDSRQSINLFVMNFALEIFEELAKILPVIILLGNHDIAKKNSNEVNSVKVLKWIPNIKVCEEPEIITVVGKKLLFMPWRANHQEEEECLKTHTADFLFCHTDVQGLKFNRNTEIQEGISLAMLKQFRKVYSGHIHYSQSKGNFRMLGCPYPLTRSDINNEKGIWCFDIENESETYFPNNYSPKFIRILFEKVLEMEEDEAREHFKNNFVDVLVDQKWTLNFPFSTFYDDIQGYRKLEFVPRIMNMEDDDGALLDDESYQLGKIDIVELANKLIQNTSHNDSLKEKLLSTIKTLHEKVQKTKEKEDENSLQELLESNEIQTQ